MEKVTRQGIFEMAAKQLRQDFEALHTVPHAALRGGEAEKLVQRFLREHLPQRFNVGSGFIIDSRDVVSRQTDVIVYDALNCPTYRVSDTAGIYPANNVAAVVEVKSKLDSNQLTDAFDKIESVKSLAKRRIAEDKPILEQTHGSVFAFNSALSLETIATQYISRFRTHKLGPHADIICVLDVGVITTVANMRGVPGWNIIILDGTGGDSGEGAHIGVAVIKTGPATLDAYFRLLLAQVSFFRSMVDHPGFNWGTLVPGLQMEVTYLTSICTEKDPIRKAQILKEYKEQAQAKLTKKQ